MFYRCVYILAALVLAASAFAQTRGAGKVVTRLPSGDQLDLYDNSWAVIIGVNDYDKWPDLQYAVNDARAIRDRMLTLGFPRSVGHLSQSISPNVSSPILYVSPIH